MQNPGFYKQNMKAETHNQPNKNDLGISKVWLQREPSVDTEDKLEKNSLHTAPHHSKAPHPLCSWHAEQASTKTFLVLGICVHVFSLLSS